MLLAAEVMLLQTEVILLQTEAQALVGNKILIL